MAAKTDVIIPTRTVTFTINSVPKRVPERKTIGRLMKMQPDIRRGLKALAKKRRQHDNHTYIRCGRPWTNRARATQLIRVIPGETFTLTITPQIVADLKSVERYLTAKAS